MSHQPQSPDHSAVNSNSSSLYCGEDVLDVVPRSADTWICNHLVLSSLNQSAPSINETRFIDTLFDSETQHMPLPNYLHLCRDRTVDVTARQDSIYWIFKVHAYYNFRPVTALLSVNYFDRFLSSHSLPANGWSFQLLSVACLSLAAKMEEPEVPLLLDLQVFEPRFVFEPKTVQRMELWVMAVLNWRLKSITPFDYLHFFISKLHSSSKPEPDFFCRIFSASSDLILSTTRVIDFLGFTPSAIAAAAVLCAVGDSLGDDEQLQVVFHERVNREMVRSCRQLMEEYLIDTCPAARRVGRREAAEPHRQAAPPSPIGVLDAAACGSCDTHTENPGSSRQADEPPTKRLRSSAPDV